MSRAVRALAFALAVTAGCRFPLERELDGGDLRGTVAIAAADGSRRAAAGARVAVVGTGATARADASGRFVLRGLPQPATYSLRITFDGDADGVPEAGLSVRRIELTGGRDLGVLVAGAFGAIGGRVLSGGEAAAGARVVLDGRESRTAGPDGTFVFDFVPPGDHELTALATIPTARSAAPEAITIAPRESVSRDVELGRVPEDALVRGRVLLKDRTSHAGVDVRLEPIAGGDAFSYSTDGEGTWGNEVLPAGLWRVSARFEEGWLPGEIPLLLVDGEATIVPDLLLVAQAACDPASPSCDGFLPDADGDGVEDAVDPVTCDADGVREGPEQCDGADLGGASCESEGFTGGALACDGECRLVTGGCSNAPVCGDGRAGGDEACDGSDFRGLDCAAFGYAGGALACTGGCTRVDPSGCVPHPACGNGNIDHDYGEECDGFADFSCSSQGFAGGDLACGRNCRLDTSGCTPAATCGNAGVEAGEECDGDVGARTCESLGRGYTGGTLKCRLCRLDTRGCTPARCGDGWIHPGTELCDGAIIAGLRCEDLGFAGGALACTASCDLDVTGCAAPAAHCANGAKDGDETATDCGGGCAPCALGAPCSRDDDCRSNVCDQGSCSSGGCGDGRRNNTETGVDCGGFTCAEAWCGDGGACSVNSDCERFRGFDCVKGACTQVRFEGGAACTDDSQCTSFDCAGGVCCDRSCSGACESCLAADTGRDPGTCGPRARGATPVGMCTEGYLCDGIEFGTCVPPHCFNGTQDADEQFTDCGGSCGFGPHCSA